jgi:gluconate kinase
MEKHEIEALYLRGKPTLERVKEQRKKHFTVEHLQQKQVDKINEAVAEDASFKVKDIMDYM